ncbi:hypothetical protein [Chitiniphilus eburneus]|uniref:hypothetical protein n=1 Tax=Chitiniphilus eburneus TaxID=2571148 RepID=UPI0035CFB607
MRSSIQIALALGWLLSGSAFADQLVQTIGYDSGATGSDSYVGPIAELKDPTSSTTISVAFESKRGTGTANIWNNRMVSWTPKYSLDGVTFTRGATRTIPVNALNMTTDAMTLNFPYKSKWIIQIEYAAADTAGTFGSSGPIPTIDVQTTLNQFPSEAVSGSVANGGVTSLYSPLPAFSPTSGTITKVKYSFGLMYTLRASAGVIDRYNAYSRIRTPGVELNCNHSIVQSPDFSVIQFSQPINCTFERDYYSTSAIQANLDTSQEGGSYAYAALSNAKAVITVATPVGTSTSASNRFRLLSATYDAPVKANALPAIIDYILE